MDSELKDKTGLKPFRSGKYLSKKNKSWGKPISDKSNKRRITVENSSTNQNKQPRLQSKTRFQWRYRNRSCYEQKWSKVEDGKEVPISKQLVYVTDSSEGEDFDHYKQRHIIQKNNDAENRLVDDKNTERKSSSNGDEIEWDYSDINLAVKKAYEDEENVFANEDNKVSGQILPNFENFEQIDIETDVLVKHPRMGTRSLKDKQQKLKIMTSFGLKPEKSETIQSPSTFKESNKSDSGIHDVFGNVNGKDSSGEKSDGNSKESDCVGQCSFEALDGLQFFSHTESKINMKETVQDIDSIVPECFVSCKDNLDSRRNSRSSDNVETCMLPKEHPGHKGCIKLERKSRSEERHSPTFQKIASNDNNNIDKDEKVDSFTKNRSKSLDVSDSSSETSSITPRSRHNWCPEHMHFGYDIKCSLCKLRSKVRELKQRDYYHHVPFDKKVHDHQNNQYTSISEKEKHMLHKPMPSPKVENLHEYKDKLTNNDHDKQDNKPKSYAKLKFQDLVKKFEDASQFPNKINISRSSSFDGSLNKDPVKQKQILPPAYRRNVQLISKEFVQKHQSPKENSDFARVRESKSGPSSAKYGRSLRTRSHSFTSGTQKANLTAAEYMDEIQANKSAVTSLKKQSEEENYKANCSLHLSNATQPKKIEVNDESTEPSTKSITWLKRSDGSIKQLATPVIKENKDNIIQEKELGNSGRNIAILDFSETEPTVRYNLQDGKQPKCGHIYYVLNTPGESKHTNKDIVNVDLSHNIYDNNPKIKAKVEFTNDFSQSFDSEEGSNSILSITDDSTLEEEHVTNSDQSIIQAAVPVHVYRSSCMVEKPLVGMSDMEFWYTQLLGVHRLILIAKICDHFKIRRWRSRRKRHVTVFYRDNFLVVCEKSNRSDFSKGESSFDVSWSPEFMSTPRDIPSQPSMEPDSLEVDELDLEKTETVKEALERIMYGRMKVKLNGEGKKESYKEDSSKRAFDLNSYSKYQRTTVSHPLESSRKFDDLEFSSVSEDSFIIDNTIHTSVWDSHIDSGYDIKASRMHVVDSSLNTSGTLSDNTLMDSSLSSNSSQERYSTSIRTNCIISEVVEKSISPEAVFDYNREDKRRNYATTIVICKTESSDTESTRSELSEDESVKSYHSSGNVKKKYISAFSIPCPNNANSKGTVKNVVFKSSWTEQPGGIGLHRFVCLDMPLNVWPVRDDVSNVLPIQHIESDNSAVLYESPRYNNHPNNVVPVRKMTTWAERSEFHSIHTSEKCGKFEDISNKDSDHSYDSIISSNDTITEVTPDSSSISPLYYRNNRNPQGIYSSNESALGTSDADTVSTGIPESYKRPNIDYWDALRHVTANTASPKNLSPVSDIEKDAIFEANEKHITMMTGIILAPSCVPDTQTIKDIVHPPQNNEDEGLVIGSGSQSRQVSKYLVKETKQNQNSKENCDNTSCNFPSQQKQSQTRDVKIKPPLPRAKAAESVYPQNISVDIRSYIKPIHIDQEWENEQWETHFGSCYDGPQIDIPNNSDDLLSASVISNMDSANRQISPYRSQILNTENAATEVKFTAYNSNCPYRNLYDTSLNNTLNETVDEDPYKVNKSFSQLENSTRILRVMDFASEGVDLMALLNKLPRSQSCPSLSLDYLDLFPTSDSKEAYECRLEKGDMGSAISDVFSEVSDSSSNRSSSLNKYNEIQFEQTEKELDPTSGLSRKLWEVPIHNNDLHIEDIDGTEDAMGNEESFQYIQSTDQRQGTPLKLPNDSEKVTNVKATSDERKSYQVNFEKEQDANNCNIKDFEQNSMEEEKSISVNVSFEIEYSQRAKEPEKIQMLLKDCKFIRQDLLEDVAKITNEITKDISENVSDESLQLEWTQNNDTAKEKEDEIICFKVSGNASNAVKVNDKTNGKIEMDGRHTKENPVLADVVLDLMDSSEESKSLPLHQVPIENESETEEIPVRIKLDQDNEDDYSNHTSIHYMSEDQVIEHSPEVIVSEFRFPDDGSAMYNEEFDVPSLRTLCYLALDVNRSSSEESFPVLVTSFRDTDVSNVDNSKSEANLSLVSLSDLSGGSPSPRVHYIVTDSKGHTLMYHKGYLSRSDDEHINLLSVNNRRLFGLEIGVSKSKTMYSDLISPSWGSIDHRRKRRYSAGDIYQYEKINLSESRQSDIKYDLNANNNNNVGLSHLQNCEDSTLSSNSRREVDYGKFYNTSYLQKPSGAQIKGPSINPKGDPKSPHYHRPENFSYSQVRRDFIKPLKKESSSMMSALGETMSVQKKKLEDFMEEPMRNKEVINLARFPDNIKHEGERNYAIEREDFPAPPATAAAYPELLYKHYKPPRKTRGGSDVDSPDGAVHQMEVDGEEVQEVDPKLLKDIDHLSKLERESGAAKVILEHLKKKSKEPPPPIDPVSSSRTPAADREPMYKTRYESHVFASPSRDLDYRSRMYSLDDQLIGRKYRSALQSVGNFPVERRTYDLPKARSNKYTVMKPGYTLRQPKTAHMPSTFASARANGYFSDIEQCVTRDSDFEDLDSRRYDLLERRALNFTRRDHELDRRSHELDRRSQELDRRSQDLDQRSQDAERRSQKSHSLHASQSSIEYEYDPITGLRRGTKLRGSSVSTDLMKTKSPYQKTLASFKSDDPPQIYDYEDLKITNLNLPLGVDRNAIEIHLSQQEFESIFRMSREEFYRLAEWKRNDMKQRVLLF